ncbi:hypothetical protein BKA69DRAFT_1089483 [Paraphysoderma sedebokerense]|nr:hypothetical protein BKA69DRAFT_1089483 [Paraphysoderma sedebokerense]
MSTRTTSLTIQFQHKSFIRLLLKYCWSFASLLSPSVFYYRCNSIVPFRPSIFVLPYEIKSSNFAHSSIGSYSQMSKMDNFLPGSASLVDCVDKRLLVVLRDGRKLTGILRSYDQFANLVLQDTIERIYVGDAYGDIPRGIFVIRGENVVLLGEIDPVKEESTSSTQQTRELPIEQILIMQRQQLEQKSKLNKKRNKVLFDRGFSTDFNEFDLY